MEILDMKCAEFGSTIGLAVEETLITKSLGVLQEDGVYAFFLWTTSKADAIKTHAFSFLKDRGMLRDGADVLKVIRESFENDIDKLLFAKELLERTLVYARYHAKAIPSPQSSPQRGEEVGMAEEDK